MRQSHLPQLKISRLQKAKEYDLTSLASDIEGMVTQLGDPATETLLHVKSQIKRAVAKILISSGSESGLSGAEQGAFLDRFERGDATAEGRGSPTFRAAVARVKSVDREVFDYLTSLAVKGSPLGTVFNTSKELTPNQEVVPGLMHPDPPSCSLLRPDESAFGRGCPGGQGYGLRLQAHRNGEALSVHYPPPAPDLAKRTHT